MQEQQERKRKRKGKKIIKYPRYQRNNRLQVNPKSAPETDATIECKTLLARAEVSNFGGI